MVEAVVRPPTLALIVLSFQNFDDTTGPCLLSLAAAAHDLRYEVIVVDNGSTDGSAPRCERWAIRRPSVHYLGLPKNLGFSGGMNAGAAIARADWLCLVNSDTIFPAGALESLLATLAAAPAKMGMLGPVTNSAGNGQRLLLPGLNMANVVQVGAQAMRQRTGLLIPTYRTDFFCVAIRRSVWHELRGLDEKFGLGYFEDFDFSLRLAAAGHYQAIMEDVFIAHVGSASFKTARADQTALMRRNRGLLLQRHPRAKLEHARVGNARALRALFADAQENGWTQALRERASWRFAALLEDEPRSWFKRWRWRRSIRGLIDALREADIEPRFPAPEG